MHNKITELRLGNQHPGSLSTFLRKLKQGFELGTMDVPCNGCTACCRDPMMFVDLTEAEAHHFKAHKSDRVTKGWELDRKENGECVYLIDNRCSIYADRPQSCRGYDCRLHLLGLPVGTDQDVLVNEGLSRWRYFSLPTVEDKVMHLAITLSVLAAISNNRDATHKDIGLAIQNWPAYRDMARCMYDDIKDMSPEELTALFDGLGKGGRHAR